MNRLQRMAFLAGSVMAGFSASAQTNPAPAPSPQLQEFSRGRVAHQRTLELTLGSYALANIALGALAAGRERTEAHYFHRMNVYWNLVNLGIAGLGLLGSRKADPTTETLSEAVRRHQSMKQTLLFNAGLDVAYMAGGAYLIERGRHNADKRDQLTGFGKSVIVQGGFLLVFDLVNYALFKKRGDRQQDALLGRTSDGVGLVIPLR
ncbi:DUF6992 family protein [Rudanella lutea]|uniref:DUF6992 family protein n=1 Tax=Rudanella lutea TaxID=451374 RepID=UPI000486E39E|nr:hypothetical protein [Rudanella lutea]